MKFFLVNLIIYYYTFTSAEPLMDNYINMKWLKENGYLNLNSFIVNFKVTNLDNIR